MIPLKEQKLKTYSGTWTPDNKPFTSNDSKKCLGERILEVEILLIALWWIGITLSLALTGFILFIMNLLQ